MGMGGKAAAVGANLDKYGGSAPRGNATDEWGKGVAASGCQ